MSGTERKTGTDPAGKHLNGFSILPGAVHGQDH